MKNPWKFLITNRVKKNSMDGKLKGNGSTRPALDVDIDAIWLEKQYHNQNGRCFYFPTILLDPQSVFASRNPMTMSVERLDDSKGKCGLLNLILNFLRNLSRAKSPPP